MVDETLVQGAKQARLNGSLGTPLLAMGLCNTLFDAKAKDDLARRDGLLEELRALAKAHPADPAVRESLARGLFIALNDANDRTLAGVRGFA